MKYFLLAFTLVIGFTGTAQTTKKVCFIGNSYTYSNDLPGLIASIATADGNILIKDQSTQEDISFMITLLMALH